MQPADLWQQWEQLMHVESLQDALLLPIARVIAAGVLSALLLLLLIVRPQTQAATNTPKQREQRGYTRAEVAQHTAEDDLWLIIRHKTTGKLQVYDVTTYVEHHPGGDAIFSNAGADCTVGFRGPQHPPTVEDLVEEYCIGWVEDA
ncbi:Cytochrome B5-like protein [Chlorella vulgaris]